MADFISIWKYVERELKVLIPPYIKNVLMCCGFDNCYTIATIEEKDVEYFQGEIRKGNLTKFFKDKISVGFQVENLLEGSTKSVEEFEICRGHQKLIISIAKLVKENLDRNGIDGFGSTAETSKARKKTSDNGSLSNVPTKRQKNSPSVKLFSSLSQANDEPVLYPEPNPEDNVMDAGEIAIHRSKLIKQVVSSLKNDTPAMFKEKFAIIQAAVTSNLVTVSRKKKGPGYSAKIKCPHCKANISVFHILKGANERGTWNSSNFGRHLEKVHMKTPKTKMTKKKAKGSIDDSDACSDDNTDIKRNENLFTKPDDNNVALAVGPVKDVVSSTLSKTGLQSIVNYSDSDESGNDDEDYTLIEIPSTQTDPVMIESAIDEGVIMNSETFILTSSEPLESLEEISIRYPDSLYESDSSNLLDEDIDEGEIGAANIEVVPIIRNGHKSTSIIPNIYTVNTCAFDSVFSIYACSYFDNQYYREAFELFVGQSRFSGLIKKFYDHFQSKTSVYKLSDLYDDRNFILKEIFSGSYYAKSDNVIKNRQYFFVNCTTGIGGLFGQICTQFGENIASAIELKICSMCETTTGKILPFLTIDYNNVDLRDIQKSICPRFSQDRLCTTCKSRCRIDNIVNDILVLEVEPNTKIEFQKKMSIQNLTETITIANKYELLAVIEFCPSNDHFLSHVKRRNNVWKTYDDLSSSERNTDVNEEIYPFLLFYKQKTYQLADYNDFKTTLLSFSHEKKLRKPLVRKILPSERLCPKTNNDSKHSGQSSSTTTSAERKRQLEKGWKY